MSPAPTPSQTVGPYFAIGLTDRPAHELVAPRAPGAIRLAGRVLDGEGEPVSDALVELWHPEVGFGRCATDGEGRFVFVLAKPPRGEEAPHVEAIVFARGLLRHVVTRVYFPDEAEANATDPVLAGIDAERRSTLVAERDGGGGLRFDVRLQGEGETVFFAV
jgi:protocatechuate 3,4-dioxygenase, alpha subunit